MSLLSALDAVPEARHARGVRHDVRAVLVVAACAALTGAGSYVALHDRAAAFGPALLDHLGLATVAPCEVTLRRTLQAVDAPALEAAVAGWIADQLADARASDVSRRLLPVAEARRVIAIDSKTPRDSARRDSDEQAELAAHGRGRVHLVAALYYDSGPVLAQRSCDMERGRGGEIVVASREVV